MNKSNKLAIGTAQFGLNYGISNNAGTVSAEEITKILEFSKIQKIQTLDTAIAYGNSEVALGANNLDAFQVVTKLPEMPSNIESVCHWVADELESSLAKLGVPDVYGFLLHRPQQLLEEKGGHLYTALTRQKELGKVSKIGISVYSPIELLALLDKFEFDIVQIPFNVLDQRLVESGILLAMKQSGIEVHVRSIFLQGLLLMPSGQRPKKFSRWASLWQKWDAWLHENGITALEGCLRAAMSVPEIDKLVIGVESAKQLQQITEIIYGDPTALPVELSCTDDQLINPGSWGRL